MSFDIGSAYYTRDGKKFELVAKTTDGKFVVSRLIALRDEYGDEYEEPGETTIVDALFEKAPREIVDAEIERLRKERDDLVRANINLRHDAVKGEEEVKKRLERLKKFDGLERLEDYLDGKITHMVIITNYNVTVSKLSDLTSNESRVHGRVPLRMITLSGRDGQTDGWWVNKYSDGSGGWERCVLCLSEEEAEAVQKDAILKMLAEGNYHLVSTARTLGLAVPREVEIFGIKENLRVADRNLKNSERYAKDLQKNKDEVASLRARLVELGEAGE